MSIMLLTENAEAKTKSIYVHTCSYSLLITHSLGAKAIWLGSVDPYLIFMYALFIT